jgi:phospholipid/cholesterol/gamma-HCH transport system substrate-binding protein
MMDSSPSRIARSNGPTDSELAAALPPPSSGHEVRIGLFVLIGVVSFLLILFLLTDPATFRGRYMVTTEVDDAGGIRRGDPVQMRGVNIGRVHRFTMIPEGVRIILEIEGEWRIPSDSHARLVSAGILGGRTVDVVPGESERALRGGEPMPGLRVEGMFDTADALGADARDMMGRMSSLLDDPTITAIQEGAEELRALLVELSGMAAAQRSEIERLTASLNRSAEGIESVATGPELARTVARADSTLIRLNETSLTLDRAVGSLQALLDRVEAGEGTLGQLSRNDELYRNMSEAAASINLLATDLREHPERYIRFRLF